MTHRDDHGQPIGEPVDWTPRRRPAPVTLSGRFVRLEPLAADHAEEIVEHLAPHPELWTYRADEPPRDAREAAQRLAHGAAERDHVTFAVIRSADGSVQGMTTLMRTDEVHGVTEVGAIIYSPELQRTPATTEATYLLARHVFDDLGYRRLEWKLDSLNAPSAAAARRLGFTEEGTFRQAMVYKGRNRDTTWFSLLDHEWPSVRNGIEAWLDPANFDADGHQRTRLSDLTSRTSP